jgi:hypothetical protein
VYRLESAALELVRTGGPDRKPERSEPSAWSFSSLASAEVGSGGYVHDTVTRFMGLIVIAMRVQFAISGMRLFMVEPDHAPL